MKANVRWKGFWALRRRARWRKTDAHIWWALTVELRYQWIGARDLANHLGMGYTRVRLGIDRMIDAGLIEESWDTHDPDHSDRLQYRAVEPQRAADMDEAIPEGQIVFFGAY